MTGFRALIMLIAIAALFLTFLPMLAITGLGDLNASNGYVPSPTAAPSGSPTAAASPAQGGNAVTISAHSIAFDKTSVTVPAGPVSITFDNADKGTMHNLHVFDGNSNSGKTEGKTSLKIGPNTQTLHLNLQKGTYYFQCDVHPDRMKGTITAK
ncbi:cupredoxin domain-containing protein [bacterium]|jgi:plastocyanin|nr:cupredoxin domain-containing protein [bacterium]